MSTELVDQLGEICLRHRVRKLVYSSAEGLHISLEIDLPIWQNDHKSTDQSRQSDQAAPETVDDDFAELAYHSS